jgi:TonB family protein
MNIRYDSDRSSVTGFLICLTFILAVSGQTVFSQDAPELKIQGVKISETDALSKEKGESETVGYWRHSTRKVWIFIGEGGMAYQCRIAKNIAMTARGVVGDDNKISWDSFWGTDTISVRNGELHLQGEEKFSLRRVGNISDEACAARLQAGFFRSDSDISGGQGSGSGNGTGGGIGTGRGTGSGSGGGIGNGDLPEKPPVRKSGENKDIVITSKPAAAYTTKAREANVQGKVLLRVTFQADGNIGSISVVSGLSHGLTEKAIEAARQIRFEPAVKNGASSTVIKLMEYNFSIY